MSQNIVMAIQPGADPEIVEDILEELEPYEFQGCYTTTPGALAQDHVVTEECFDEMVRSGRIAKRTILTFYDEKDEPYEVEVGLPAPIASDKTQKTKILDIPIEDLEAYMGYEGIKIIVILEKDGTPPKVFYRMMDKYGIFFDELVKA